MILKAVIGILRHNTELGGDVRLAVREFEALAGIASEKIDSRASLSRALPNLRISAVPEISKSKDLIALLWRDMSIDRVNRLLKQSAFAQELIVTHDSADSQEQFERNCAAQFVHVNELNGRATVALAWSYVIESEAVLDSTATRGRVRRTAALLLEPYLMTKVSAESKRLRRAKKTTLSLSHDLHIYKAKFFPRMIRALLNIYSTNRGLIVDPFCGSGTALLEASLLGLDSHGVDIDPICQLIARTKVTPFLEAQNTLPVLESFEASLTKASRAPVNFRFPEELGAKLARRDRIDGTSFDSEIRGEAAILAYAVAATAKKGIAGDLVKVLASDAVTKKIRYRFVGVGNGRYTIEIMKQPLLDRVRAKIQRARQLCYVFEELRQDFGFEFGKVNVSAGTAIDANTWNLERAASVIVTSPPYLPASSGREHYSASRALSFAVLGLEHGSIGYYNTHSNGVHSEFDLTDYPEGQRLMDYLMSDASDAADPQRDAMRFERKAMPTRQYLSEMKSFFDAVDNAMESDGSLLLVVANQHTFYSHRRKELEHVVSGRNLYSELAKPIGIFLDEEIKMELLKSAVSKARPRASEDYFESVLVSHKENVSKSGANGRPLKSFRVQRANAA